VPELAATGVAARLVRVVAIFMMCSSFFLSDQHRLEPGR
jgi:hypothetical protein